MTELTIEKRYRQDLEMVFAFLVKVENILKWWGPQGVTIPDHALNFATSQPWFSTMENKEGQKFKVSGMVTELVEPNILEFTWAWHDEHDIRGHESLVRFELAPDKNGGTLLKLNHTGLEDNESANNHDEGWTSSLARLDILLS